MKSSNNYSNACSIVNDIDPLYALILKCHPGNVIDFSMKYFKYSQLKSNSNSVTPGALSVNYQDIKTHIFSLPYIVHNNIEFKNISCILFCHEQYLILDTKNNIIKKSKNSDDKDNGGTSSKIKNEKHMKNEVIDVNMSATGISNVTDLQSSNSFTSPSLNNNKVDLQRLCTNICFNGEQKVNSLLAFEIFRKLNIPYGSYSDFEEFCPVFHLSLFTVLLLTWCGRMYQDISSNINKSQTNGENNKSVSHSIVIGSGNDGMCTESYNDGCVLENIDVNVLIMHLRQINMQQCHQDYGCDTSIEMSLIIYNLVLQTLQTSTTLAQHYVVQNMLEGSSAVALGGLNTKVQTLSVQALVTDIISQHI